MKLKVNNVSLDPIRVGDRLEFRFNAPEDLQYLTIEKDDFIGDLDLSEIQLEQSTVATSFVEPMESETVASGVFKSVQGISYEITNPNSDTWASIKQSVDGSITTYHNGTLQSTIAHTIEDIIFGISDIAGGDESSFNLRLGGIQQSVKDQMFSSVQTQLAGFVGIQLEDIEGNYNEILNTVNAHSQTIGSSGGNLAQMVMNDSLFRTNVINRIAGTESSYTQLSNYINLRVNGSQITIGGDNITIDSKSIYLGSSTQIADGIITNKMIASNAQIDAAKISNLTVSNAQIISLDVSKLSGNTTNFVQSKWNSSVGGGVSISGTTGVRTRASSREESRLENGGISFYSRDGWYRGKVDSSYSNDGVGGVSIFIQNGSHFSIVRESSGYVPILWLEGYSNIMQMNTNVGFKGNRIVDVQSIRFSGGNAAVRRQGANNVEITTHGEDSTAVLFGQTTAQFYRGIDMNGRNITNQSDIRLKTNVEDSQLDALREIDRLRFIDYDWDTEKSINEGKPTERQFGIVAQYSPFLQTKAGESESYLSVDLIKQINLISKASQELLHYTRMLEDRIEVLEDGKRQLA